MDHLFFPIDSSLSETLFYIGLHFSHAKKQFNNYLEAPWLIVKASMIFVSSLIVDRRHWVSWRVVIVKIQHCKSRNFHTAEVSQSSDMYTNHANSVHSQ